MISVKTRTLKVNGWISVAGLLYVVIVTLGGGLLDVISVGSALPPRMIYASIFNVLLLPAIISMLKGKRWSYRLAATAAGIFVIFQFLGFVGSGDQTAGNPLNPIFFLTAISPIPILLLVVFHAMRARREIHEGFPSTTASATRRLFLPSIVVVGFVAGGASLGLINSQIQSSSTDVIMRDVTIVDGAFHFANPQFYVPAKLTVKVGETVVWYNADRTGHTVTSINGAFNSGDIPVGAIYRHTFTEPGTYEYTCEYHYLMIGVIVVTSTE